MLKWILWMVLPIGMLSGCHGGGDRVSAPGLDSVEYRRRMIEELEAVHVLVAANNRDSMARLFHFPIPDSMLSIYMADTAEDRLLKAGAHGVRRAVFDSLYGSLGRAWKLGEFSRAFDELDLKALLHKNRIEHHDVVKTEPCYTYYAIDFGVDSILSISYGTNTNNDYRGKSASGLRVDDCEFAIIWQFKFDGEKLRLVRQTSAG